MGKRVFLIVLDSMGIGGAPDVADFNDEGSDTLRSIYGSSKFYAPTLTKMGIFNIDENDYGEKEAAPIASFARIEESSKGKDTTIGHWEIAGCISKQAMPTYPNGFPNEVIEAFTKLTGRGVLCNKPYSGTDVIRDYGKEHMETGKLIVYTSADSVFQIAAHEDIVPLEKLYEYCKQARELLKGEHAVGRVIARPFIGEVGSFKRTSHRHDFSLVPPKDTMLDKVLKSGLESIGVGKIYDIFAGKGVGESLGVNEDNNDGMRKTFEMQKRDFSGLCFINLVDFDMVYGHRNDIDGYANAVTEFDAQLKDFIKGMREDDMLMITADHGCDPGTPSTDHSRECVPMIVYGKKIKSGVNLHRRKSYADMAATILDYLGIKDNDGIDGESFLEQII